MLERGDVELLEPGHLAEIEAVLEERLEDPRNPQLPSFEIGYWARTSETGRGYFTESTAGLVRLCFERLGAERVELVCDPQNVRSTAVAERVGFVLEGTMRRALPGVVDGRPRDKRVYGLVRADWDREGERIAGIAEGKDRRGAPTRR